jgi:hypothetical protein
MSNSYYLFKIKHELCFVNNILNLGNQIYSIDLPVILPVKKLNATDGRSLMQRIIFQHFNSNASRQIGFLRGMISLCSEPEQFQTHLMLSCSTDQIGEASETEWISAIEKGLDSGLNILPSALISSDVKLNAWGIDKFIYDVKIEFWPDSEESNSFLCDCLVKYIIPEDAENINNFDAELGFNFLLINHDKISIPFLIKSESKPYFFMNDAEIIKYEIKIDEDKVGHELFVHCKIKK